MAAKVDLYDNAYANYGAEVYRQIRLETYGDDFGQTSWVTTCESREIPRTLVLRPDSSVLEIGCGSGQYALLLAEIAGCRVLGVDINQPGIDNANQLAAARNMSAQVRFERCDASKKLPFDNATFDGAFANDVLCHIPSRRDVLRELYRVIRTGGKLLFSDALIIGGMISHQEIASRSSIGYYIFSPPGENERLLQDQGFRLCSATDTTQNAAEIARRWHDARQARTDALLRIEGEATFGGIQQFLSTVHTLTSERRLRRFLYVAEKPDDMGDFTGE
jgi:ubiquinone/menaquinone biosynthesis C-methylase UbiE